MDTCAYNRCAIINHTGKYSFRQLPHYVMLKINLKNLHKGKDNLNCNFNNFVNFNFATFFLVFHNFCNFSSVCKYEMKCC